MATKPFTNSVRGRVRIAFDYLGHRCEEYLGPDNKDTRRAAAELKRVLTAELIIGTFDYAKRFPGSKRIAKLGLLPKPTVSVPTLADFTRDWLKERVSVTPQTVHSYEGQLGHVFKHDMGALAINAIDDGRVARFMGDLEKGGLGAPQRGAVLIRLRSIFNVALRRKLVSDNPAKWVTLPRRPKPQPDPFTCEEVADVVAAAKELDAQDHAIVVTYLGTGLRPNELFGLQWPDIDWRRGMIKVRRTSRRKRFGSVGPTKTPGSEREIPMDESVRGVLHDQQTRTGKVVTFPGAPVASTPWVFSRNGAMIDMDGWRRRTWSRILLKAKVRERALMETRHTYAALRLENGDNPNDIADAMGHTSLKMLVTVYGRRTRSRKIAPSTVLDEILSADRGLAQRAQNK